jgi:hypothetical protein
MGYSRVSCFFEEDALVTGRIVEPAKPPVAEFRIELRPLEREGVEPRRVAAEGEGAAFRLGQKPASVPGADRRIEAALYRIIYIMENIAAITPDFCA